jgi:hypothetical protein
MQPITLPKKLSSASLYRKAILMPTGNLSPSEHVPGITLAAYETRASRRAFTILELKYGGKVQVTFGKLRWYSRGALGARIGTFSERKNQAAKVDFPEIREWAFGVNLFGSSLYRPTIHRLEFSVSEDDARFIGGEIKKKIGRCELLTVGRCRNRHCALSKTALLPRAFFPCRRDCGKTFGFSPGRGK